LADGYFVISVFDICLIYYLKAAATDISLNGFPEIYNFFQYELGHFSYDVTYRICHLPH